MTNYTLLVIMDPIRSINIKKDSTFAMLLEAQQRNWRLLYAEQGDIYVDNGKLYSQSRELRVHDRPKEWFSLERPRDIALAQIDVVLLRKDPPFDMEYFYTTLVLEMALAEDILILNHPRSIRDVNEKLYTHWFPQCCPPSVVSRQRARLKTFLDLQGDIIVKPLDSMGGHGIFRVRQDDPNVNVILETLTEMDQRTVIAQRYIPEIINGDKRILLIDGEPLLYALARIPAQGETRANLAAGGTGIGVELSARDRWICEQVGPTLREKELLFVGLDVIGDYLTEINVTSPTGVRELDSMYDLNICGMLLDAIETKLGRNSGSEE